MSNIIPVADLPKVVAGASDHVVIEQNGNARRAPIDSVAGAASSALAAGNIFADTAAGVAGSTDGQYFTVPSSTTTGYLDLYRNDSGTATLIKTYPSKQAVDDAIAALNAKSAQITANETAIAKLQTSQTIGDTGNPITDGTTAVAAGTYTLTTPIANGGNKARFAYFGRGAGTAYVQVCSRAGSVVTVIREVSVPISLGYNEADLTIDFEAGQYFGIRVNDGRLAISSGTPSYGYWSTAGVQVSPGNTYTDAVTDYAIFKLRFEAITQTVTAQAQAQLKSDLAATKVTVGSPSDPTIWWGGPGSTDPQTGSALGASTYAIGTPVADDRMVKRVRAYVLTPGTIILRRYTRSGSVMTAIPGELTVTFSGTGVQEGVFDAGFQIPAGAYYAIKGGTGSVAVSGRVPTNGGYVIGSGDTSAGFTITSSSASYTIEVGVELDPFTHDKRLAANEKQIASLKQDGSLATPDSYLLVWGLGESHMAGRGEYASTVTLPAGAAYKFVRSSGTLVAMADPTGNDATALTGKGSAGPALARAVWEATGGAMGVIFVNSGEGSTFIGTNWASGGGAWTNAVSDYNAAVTAINTMKLPVSGGVAYLNIGSNDASTSTTKATFKAGVLDLLTRVQATAGTEVQMALAQTGPFNDGSYAAGVATIQAAQVELVRENAAIHMAWTGAKTFPSRALMVDVVHYKQAGNDIMGRGASAVLIAVGAGKSPSGIS